MAFLNHKKNIKICKLGHWYPLLQCRRASEAKETSKKGNAKEADPNKVTEEAVHKDRNKRKDKSQSTIQNDLTLVVIAEEATIKDM